MDLGENSRSYSFPGSTSFRNKSKFRKLIMSVMAVLQVVRLMKSMRRLCVDPAAAGIEPEEISIDPRKEQEILHPCQYESRHLNLMFSSNINGPIFTRLPVSGEGSNLNLDLVDPLTHNVIKSGPEASSKVEIVVLEKEFKSHCQGNWTAEEFKSRIVRSWTDKSLIRGDPHVTLKDGSVSVSHISFKHSRVPMRKREFRLGARAVYAYDGTRIMEAVTEPFVVKDRRNMSKSQRALSLDDEVWRLQGIGKGGAFHDRLMKENIKTVRDFLTQYFLNREKLVDILGRRMNAKKLDAAVHQAKSKLVFQKYVHPSAHSQQNQNGRVEFTDVGEVIGVVFHESHFVSFQNLTGTQKDSAMELVKTAIQHGQNVKLFDDDDTSKIHCSSSSPNAIFPWETAALDGSNGLSSDAYCPLATEMQQGSNANFMPSTSVILVDNCDSLNQIHSATSLIGEVPVPLPYEGLIYQPLPASIWDN